MVSLEVVFRCMEWAYFADYAKLWAEPTHPACGDTFRCAHAQQSGCFYVRINYYDSTLA